MTAGDSKAALTITPQPALAPSPQPRPAPTARALPPGLVAQVGQNWTPIVGQNWMPIDRSPHQRRMIALRRLRPQQPPLRPTIQPAPRARNRQHRPLYELSPTERTEKQRHS